jgi:heat shock protein HslJ
MTVRHLPLILITLALCGCAYVTSALASSSSGNSTSATANSEPAPASAIATNASMLIGTRWILFSANDGMGRPIAPLQTSPYCGALELSFADRRISVSGGCNRFAAPYRYEADRMDVGEMMQTTMKCDDTKLKAIDDAIAMYLKGAMKVGFINDSRTPGLQSMQLLTPDGTQLRLYAATETTPGGDYATIVLE